MIFVEKITIISRSASSSQIVTGLNCTSDLTPAVFLFMLLTVIICQNEIQKVMVANVLLTTYIDNIIGYIRISKMFIEKRNSLAKF